ncbi:ribbon-helix-helix domain-containing protein [uncultured Nisaea sp.]|jgi:predicted DNA-binding ribbon-helix-helix protein|uniref:ribbon-helix-helix domain-containing protein n=1 Tax=uncultured Nisaea sp. TaxID=538215 RepID=UPI0030EE8B2C|tara:strand:+ start:134 stop:397 length:264 start_codon:yes stop_codon:yes gene_type:complete
MALDFNGVSMSSSKSRKNVYAGHRTSIILEEDFWDALEECAHDRELCIDSIVTDAEKAFPEMSRTAAVRMFLLEHFRTKAEDTDPIH